MSINRFVNNPENPLHTSGYVKAVRARRIGSTSPQPFSQRARIEANRQAIAKYRDSHVGTGRAAYDNTRRASVGDSSAAQLPQPTAPPPAQHGYKEPPGRGYNPYA